MSTGDETKAGLPPSLPPRRNPGDGVPGSLDHFGSIDDDLGSADAAERFFNHVEEPPPGRTATRPKILAPQAGEWAESGQEMEVVRGRRTGLILLFLLCLLVVAAIALILALLSAFRGGDDVNAGQAAQELEAADGAIDDGLLGAETGTDDDGSDDDLGATVVDPNALQVVVTEEPFICDGGTRPFAQISGAAAAEQVDFTSPQSSGLVPGTADNDGVLSIRWQCDPEQAGTVWELTATGATSGKTATFIFAGALAAAGGESAAGGETDPNAQPATQPTALAVELIEDPFVCNGETRIFGGLTGAAPDEEVRFSSPQSSGAIKSGTADADGALPVRWNCTPDQAGTAWDLTATGATSGRTVTFTLTGS